MKKLPKILYPLIPVIWAIQLVVLLLVGIAYAVAFAAMYLYGDYLTIKNWVHLHLVRWWYGLSVEQMNELLARFEKEE